MNIVSRGEWGARPPTSQRFTTHQELFLHHSVGYGTGGAAYMRAMQRFHMDDRGWSDIAYNHAYDPQRRTFYEGRGFGVRPGAQASYNTGTHALVVMGDYQNTPTTTVMVEDIAGFYLWAQTRQLLPAVTVKGHRDAPNQNTPCPGQHLYQKLPTVNQLIEEAQMPLTDDDIQRIWRFPRVSGVDIQTALTRIHDATAGFDDDVDLIVAAIGALPAATVDEIKARL